MKTIYDLKPKETKVALTKKHVRRVKRLAASALIEIVEECPDGTWVRYKI